MPNATLHQRSRKPGLIDPNITNISLFNGLLAYWKMDEASGNRLDALGVNDLVPTGTVTSTTGRVGDAAVFAAGSHYLTGGALSNTSRSVSVWVYPTNITTQFVIASGGTSFSVGTPMWQIVGRRGGGAGPFAVYHGGSYRDATTQPTVNSWHHIVYTFDGTTVNLYVNGTVERTIAAASTNAATGTFFGNGFNNFAGRIDEAGIWNRALTQDEITALYNGGAGLTYPFV